MLIRSQTNIWTRDIFRIKKKRQRLWAYCKIQLRVWGYYKLTFPVSPGQNRGGGSGDRALGSSDDFIFKASCFNNARCILFLVNFYLTKELKFVLNFSDKNSRTFLLKIFFRTKTFFSRTMSDV